MSDELQDDPATVVIVGIIPLEFFDQDGSSSYLKGDVMVEEAGCEALVPAKLKEIKFKKWTKAHLRPLYIKAHVNKKPSTRVLIDGGVVFNVMPYSTVEKLGKSPKDFKKTNMTMSNFTRGSTLALGFLLPSSQ